MVTPAALRGLKYCCLCKEFVHPAGEFTECKTEGCANKARMHKKCIYEHLKTNKGKVETTCGNCRLISVWEWRPWIKRLEGVPERFVWICMYAFFPMFFLKLLGVGDDHKWDFSRDIISKHIFSSLLLTVIGKALRWFYGKTARPALEFFQRWCCCCCCIPCCRRRKFDDIY